MLWYSPSTRFHTKMNSYVPMTSSWQIVLAVNTNMLLLNPIPSLALHRATIATSITSTTRATEYSHTPRIIDILASSCLPNPPNAREKNRLNNGKNAKGYTYNVLYFSMIRRVHSDWTILNTGPPMLTNKSS